MKKRVLLGIGLTVLLPVLILGITRYMEIRKCQIDPNWQIAERNLQGIKCLVRSGTRLQASIHFQSDTFAYTASEGNNFIVNWMEYYSHCWGFLCYVKAMRFSMLKIPSYATVSLKYAAYDGCSSEFGFAAVFGAANKVDVKEKITIDCNFYP